MVSVENLSQLESVEGKPAADYSLSYRGHSYRIQKQRLNPPAENPSLIGKRLQYRGTAYEIVSAESNKQSAKSDKIFSLCYRGVIFWTNPKASHSTVSHMAV